MSTRWVKNIRDHVKERQKIVLKVLRVNPKKGQIDLSLRRVTTPEKNQKSLQRKRDKKAETILNIAAEKLKVDDSETNKIREKIIDEYESLIDAFEDSVENGERIFSKINIPKKWIKVLLDESKARIKPEKVKVRGVIELISLNPNGIMDVKNALLSIKKIKKKRGAILKAYTIGAPKYRIEIIAKNYLDAESILKNAEEEIIATITRYGGSGRVLD
jgi:translation initiation factor 2 subunit 1